MTGSRPAALAAALIGGLALAGCMAGPNHVPPKNAEAGAAFLRAGDAQAAAPAARWWDDLGDPLLSELVAKGLRNAPAVAAAEARVRQARAGLRASRAALLPQLSASALYIYADLPGDALGNTASGSDLFTLGFDAQWEADLWGGKRRAVQRANAEAAVAAAQLADSQVSLVAEIARSYIDLRAREASLALVERRLRLERRLADIAQSRQQGGTGTRQDYLAAASRAEQSEAERAVLAADIAGLRDMLAVLTGETPGALDGLAPAAVPLPPATVNVGDPAAMLKRRPDIMAAERRLAAATARIGVEEARRFPAISLFGLIGIGGGSADDMFESSRLASIAFPRISWNFLDFGRTAAAVRGAEAGRDAANAEYREAVLAALQDAEASLARYGAARIRFGRAAQIAGHAQESAGLQEVRAKGGSGSDGEALEAERQAIEAEIAEVNARAGLTLAYVALTKALGLGWAQPPQPASTR